MFVHLFILNHTAVEASDAASTEGGRGEEFGAEGGDHHRGGADEHPEEVLPRHPRAQLRLPGQGRCLRQRAHADEHDDGAAQVLQPPLPHQRR